MDKIIIKTYQNKDHEASRDLLKEVLSIDEENLDYNERGKPYLKDGSLFFNISHSRGIIGIAVSDREIGFDLERVKDVSLDTLKMLSEKIYNDSDRRNNACDIASIQKVFTIKEAYLKYIGIGLVMNINKIIIDYDNKTIKYQDYREGHYKTYEYCDILFSVVSTETSEYEIIYKDLN